MAATAMGKPAAEDLLLAAQADTEGWYGKLKNARELTQSAIESADAQRCQRDRRNLSGGGSSARSGIGQPRTGTCRWVGAMKLAPNRDVRDLGLSRSRGQATRHERERLATELDKTSPLDTLVQKLLASQHPGRGGIAT